MIITGLPLSFESPLAWFFTPTATCYFAGECYQQHAISTVAWGNQTYSAVKGVTGYGL